MATTNKRPWYLRWWGATMIVFSLLFLSLCFALLLAFLKIRSGTANTPPESLSYRLDPEKKLLLEGENSYWLGSPDPAITIVEFGDYSCPACLASFPKIRELTQKYKETARFIFRDYPVVSEHSLLLAQAANCAGKQGLFWPMHDKLFINQGVKEKTGVKQLASQIGLNTADFNACLDQEKTLNQIKKDLADGQALEVPGTPTFFINGQKISGDIPYEMLENIIMKYITTK